MNNLIRPTPYTIPCKPCKKQIPKEKGCPPESSPSTTLSPSSPPIPIPPPVIPSVVGNYILLDNPLGSGLTRCLRLPDMEEFACKVVSKERGREALAAHARMAGHPHVNPVLEVVVGPARTYIVFPRAGADLYAYVRARRRLPESQARPLVAQIARTLAAAHGARLVLRDLKLRKFVFKDQQRKEIKLESLEDAVVLEDSQDDWLDVKHGCPAYVSPEVLSPGGRYCGRAADCWSLGVLTYAMLVGRYPFHDPQHSALFTKIRQGSFVIPESVSPKARCLIRSLLRRDASERLTAEEVLEHPWFQEGGTTPDPTDQCVP